MVWELAVTEFKMRDQGTFLGFFWTLLHPLLYFIVFYNLFKKWMGHHISQFPLYLIIGIVQWTFFAAATSSAIAAIKRGGEFVKSINFPKSVLVYSSVLTILFSYLLEMAILLVFWVIIGKSLSMKVFFLLPILMLQVFLVTGIAFLLSTTSVFFLDIERIWGIFTSLGLFLTPIFYTMELLSPEKRWIILINPMTHIIQASRAVLLDNMLPPLRGLGYVLLLAVFFFLLGRALFSRYEGLFVEKI